MSLRSHFLISLFLALKPTTSARNVTEKKNSTIFIGSFRIILKYIVFALYWHVMTDFAILVILSESYIGYVFDVVLTLTTPRFLINIDSLNFNTIY